MNTAANPREMIGGNKPPDPIGIVRITTADLSDWLRDHPVIGSHDEAKEAKTLIDRARAALRELDADRKSKVDPLNATVKSINEEYRSPKDMLDKIADELKRRQTAFLADEEARRAKAAEDARLKAEAAHRAAQEALAREAEARENAAQGEIGAPVGESIIEAAERVAEADRAARQAAIAEKDVTARVSTGFGKSASMRTFEIPQVENAVRALMAIGPSQRITDAILAEARSYKQRHGEWPAGIKVAIERRVA